MTHKQDLRTLCECVMHWVKTPGNHGGNPHCHDFVKVAERMLAQLDREGGLDDDPRATPPIGRI